MDRPKDENGYSDEDVARRRDEALRRALATPPQPRKPTGKKGKSPAKAAALNTPPKPKRGRVGSSQGRKTPKDSE